jgi:hypothetical protein
MNILEHNGQGATIHLEQRDLLMVMALVQEGRDSFQCNGLSGKALDQLFSTANILVEEARRKDLRKNMLKQRVGKVAERELMPEHHREASNS